MRVHLVDPAAYTPPYDHALSAALARAGADVTLVTGPFAHGDVPRQPGYAVDERFYRWSPARGRRLARLAQHVPDMVRYRASGADVVHFQWLPVQAIDGRLLPRVRPRVLTAHDVMPREPRPGQLRGQRRLYERMDAIVVHSRHGRSRLVDELGIDSAKVEVIPHGAFTHLADLPEGALPRELAAGPSAGRPVVLFFGLLRPYKGLDVLLEAWRGIEDAELWVVGRPFGVELPSSPPPGVRFVPRFVADAEIPALFARADLVVLPYRDIDQSGVLFTALAFGRPLLLSDVGGFPEIDAAEHVPAGDPAALRERLRALLADPERRDAMAAASARAAAEDFSWDAIARRHLALYERLSSARPSSRVTTGA